MSKRGAGEGTSRGSGRGSGVGQGSGASRASTAPSRRPQRGGGRVRVTRLVVLASPDADAVGRSTLLEDRLVIGRTRGAGTLALADKELSRSHAALAPDRQSGDWCLVDLGSRNGCYVRGERQERADLGDGAILRLGNTLLLFQELALRPDELLEAEQGSLLGPSIAMQRLRAELGQVAPRPVSVLLLGESGVGKELAAAEIHRRSGRRGAFVPVNCGALPENLVESELFGHATGAFTGADRPRAGLFAAARDGTLFLDEIGEMPRIAQPKLLRALASGEVRPVGATDFERIDVRVVAATNRVELEAAIAGGAFRGDLYARLAGWTVIVPPLRERRDDILPLARRALGSAGAGTAIAADVAEALLLHDWPYNVRELEQAMAAVAVRAAGARSIELQHLPPELAARIEARHGGAAPPEGEVPIEVLVRRGSPPNRDELELVLRRFAGNIAKVAEFFGRDRRQIYRWADRLGINPDGFRSGESIS